MSSADRFERELASALRAMADPHYPDYFDEVLDRSIRGSQRPAWTFPERWLPMSAVSIRSTWFPGLSWRTFTLLLAIGTLIAAAAVIIGTGSQHLPPPYGPTSNGLIALEREGDIFVRDLDAGIEEAILAGPETDVSPIFSRDGRQVAFIRVSDDPRPTETLMVADADGGNPHVVAGPEQGLKWWEWSPDGSEIVIASVAKETPRLSIVNVRGTPVRRSLGLPATPLGVYWLPPDGQQLLVLPINAARPAIQTMPAGGGESRTVVRGDVGEQFWLPVGFSPDGRTIAFSAVPRGGAIEIRLLEVASGEMRTFGAALSPPAADVGEGPVHNGFLAMAPDGSRILFGRYWDEHGGEINHQLFVGSVAADGADAVPVGPLVRSRSGELPFGYLYAPDGSTILIRNNVSQEMLLGSPSGGNPVSLRWDGALVDWQRSPD